MPIDYVIDHARRLVLARGRGVFSHADVFGYQRDVWSRPEVAGYDELVDMTEVTHFEVPAPAMDDLKELAAASAAMDAPGTSSRFAIVAPDALAFGLGRMYQAYRELRSGGAKQVAVFRTRGEAFAFLGTDDPERS